MVLLPKVARIWSLAACLLLHEVLWSAQRPQYRIDASVDYDLLTFNATAGIRIPVQPDDPLSDLVFLIYANHSAALPDARRRNISVDTSWVDGSAPVPFTLAGPVLRVKLLESRSSPFTILLQYHGIVPRQPAGSAKGGLAEMLAGPGADFGRLLGLAGDSVAKPRNTDYGLYTYGNGILSLGSFWYPQLAMRRDGRWIDSVPDGVGDVAFSELSDFSVSLSVPDGVVLASTGQSEQAGAGGSKKTITCSARGVRDFAVLMSEDYVRRTETYETDPGQVRVEGYARQNNESRLARAVDIAGHAIQIFSRRFGPYPYRSFTVAEGPIRGGASGMEFSGLTSVASMLFQDWDGAIQTAAGSEGLAGLGQILAALTGNPAPGENSQGTATSPSGRPGFEFLKSILGSHMETLGSMFEMTIAHEVAHQWWAIAVGNDSIRNPFVDESLANYSAILYFEDRYGKEAAERMIDLHLASSYSAGRMLAGKDAPANLPAASYAGNLQYAAVIYGKGALYYRSLRKAVGDEVFFESLREYYRKFAGRIAGPRDLLEIVQARAPEAGAETIYRRWIEEMHGDEDIGAGSLLGIGDILKHLLSPPKSPAGPREP